MRKKIFNLKIGADKYLWLEWCKVNPLFDLNWKFFIGNLFSLNLSFLRFKLEYINENQLPF